MKKIKILSVLVAVTFCFSIVGHAFAAVKSTLNGRTTESVLEENSYTTPSQAAVTGEHTVEKVIRKDNKYYVEFSANSKTFKVEIVDNRDKNIVDAYDKAKGLYITIPKDAEVKDGVISKYSSLKHSNSYSSTHYLEGPLSFNNLQVNGIQKETIYIPTGRVAEQQTSFVGYATLPENGRKIYVQVSAEDAKVAEAGGTVTASFNLSNGKFVEYYRTDYVNDDKHIIPSKYVKFEVKESVDVSGNHKVEGIKREDGKYYVSFSAGAKTFWVEVVKEEDKNEIDAYDRAKLGLYVEIPKGVEAEDGIISQYSTIYNPDSYSPTAYASDINVKGLSLSNVQKETVKIPTGRVPEEREAYIGTATTENGRKIYVEVPEEYVGKDIKISVNISDKDYVKYYKADEGKYVLPKENVKFEVKESVDVSGNHKVEGIKREDGKYYVSFSAGAKTFWVEVVKEEDKNEIDAYDRAKLGLYVEIPKGVEAEDGIISQYSTIYNPDSYSPTAYASDINVKGLSLSNVQKETVKIPTGRVPEEREAYIGTATTENGRKIYVEVPEEYVGKDIKISVNISDKDYVKYYKADEGKYVLPKENVKFEVKESINNLKTNDEQLNISEQKEKEYRIKNNDTYGKIKIGKGKNKNYLIIYNKNDKEVTKVKVKGCNKKQKNYLIDYYNKKIRNKNKNYRSVKKLLNNLNKKATEFRILNKYGKEGLNKTNKITNKMTGYNLTKVYNIMENKISTKSQLNKVYFMLKSNKKNTEKDLIEAILKVKRHIK